MPSHTRPTNIGARIKQLRLERGLTLVQLGGLAGLSHSFLSQVERGVAHPSQNSLELIARALGSSQLELFAEPAIDRTNDGETGITLTRSAEGTEGPFSGDEARLLIKGDRPFHPIELTGRNSEFGNLYTHPEDEFVYVLEGSIELDFASATSQVLEAGDSAYYVGGTPHRWRSVGAGYKLLIVKQAPTTQQRGVLASSH